MERYALILSLIVKSIVIDAQSYTLNSYSGNYIEIETYNSMALETLGDFNWIYEFDFGFTFPYYSESYESMICYFTGDCLFEGTSLNTITMQLLSFGYQFDNVISYDIDSDVRFKQTVKDGQKALVVQFTKVKLINDFSVNEYDSHINFQWWFFEDGKIQIRFGPRNLLNSNVYVPGEGFYFINFPIDSYISGPYISLLNPNDESDLISIQNFDDENDISVLDDSIGILRTLPPEGWVIEFEKLKVSNKEIKLPEVKVFPNPVSNVLNIELEGKIEKLEVFNLAGAKIMQSQGSFIEVDALPKGSYVLKVHSNKTVLKKRFTKL